jgi:hypothetical protein
MRMRSCKARYSELDAAVYKFLSDERCAGRSASNKQLMAKALEIAPKLNIPDRFKASCMWLKRWKRRNGVSLQCATNDSQKLPVDFWDVLHAYGFRANIMQQ